MISYGEELYEHWKRLDHSGSIEEYDDVAHQWYDTYNPERALHNRLREIEWWLGLHYGLILYFTDNFYEQDVLSLRWFIEIAGGCWSHNTMRSKLR